MDNEIEPGLFKMLFVVAGGFLGVWLFIAINAGAMLLMFKLMTMGLGEG